MKIDNVALPSLEGKTTIESIQVLHETLWLTMQHIMRMSNEIEELKHRVESLERR